MACVAHVACGVSSSLVGSCEAESGVFARLGLVPRPKRIACGAAGGVFARLAPAPAMANHDAPGRVRLGRLRVDHAVSNSGEMIRRAKKMV